MIPRRTGVILALGGSGPQTIPGMGGAKVAFDAVESHRRQWAVEVGQYGKRGAACSRPATTMTGSEVNISCGAILD
jgi:hypothetical protein